MALRHIAARSSRHNYAVLRAACDCRGVSLSGHRFPRPPRHLVPLKLCGRNRRVETLRQISRRWGCRAESGKSICGLFDVGQSCYLPGRVPSLGGCGDVGIVYLQSALCFEDQILITLPDSIPLFSPGLNFDSVISVLCTSPPPATRSL